MEVGCGGVGLRTSRGEVVNLYFWHLENEHGVSVRREDFLGPASSPRVKRELVRRMAMYDRRAQQALARRVAKLERRLGRVDTTVDEPLVIIEDLRAARPLGGPRLVAVGARGI